MPPDEGKAKFPGLYIARVKSPRLGTAYPKIDREEKGRLGQASIRLNALLQSLPPATPTAGPPAAPARTPGRVRQPEEERNVPEPPAELPDLVNLDQAAALVNRTPDGLRHYRGKGMPKPFIPGTKGQPNQYLWSEMRPWLERQFNRQIPAVAILKFRSSGR
jgi:hypothetical protein